jgi:hypothetical protein
MNVGLLQAANTEWSNNAIRVSHIYVTTNANEHYDVHYSFEQHNGTEDDPLHAVADGKYYDLDIVLPLCCSEAWTLAFNERFSSIEQDLRWNQAREDFELVVHTAVR